ncbi:MAG TPA: hypothetical protein VJZ51_06455 [Bacilli bacterium]|nr:hypothetical protein [Bacilli bacterium]
MKFPKEKARLIQIIKDYKKNNDYDAIIMKKDDIMLLVDELDDTAVIDDLLMSMFMQTHYDDIIILGEELNKKGYESWTELYYLLLSCLGNLDIFYGMSLINRSTILNDAVIKEYYSEDGSNYLNILLTNKITVIEKTVLILVNFIIGLFITIKSKVVITKEFLAIDFFALLDTLYEFGNSEEVIKELTDKIKMMFFPEV